MPFALLFASACVQTQWLDAELFDSTAERVFKTGYDQIAHRYIKPVRIDDLALDGLQGLAAVDPSVAVVRRGGVIQLTADEQVLAEFEAPGEDDPEGWALVTVEVMNAGQNTRPILQVATDEALWEAVFDAALEDLDGFTRYSNAADAREERARRVGFGGIGIRIQVQGDTPEIVSVIPGTPAAVAGLQEGDRITHVDDEPVTDIALPAVVDRLRGPMNSRVDITIQRPDRIDPFNVTLQRQRIVMSTVSTRREGDILYVQISTFNQDTAKTLAQRLVETQVEGGTRLSGIILDLRDNPGGLLEQAVQVSDLFLAKGEIISTRGRHPNSFQHFNASQSDLTNGVPLAILVNGNTASASEIVAAALQDHGRAVVIGSNSFGKGTVQTVIHLPNEGELILTWSNIHAPSGYTFNRLGIMPALCTSGVTEGAATVLESLRQHTSNTEDLLNRWRQHMVPDTAVSEPLRATCPADKGHRELDIEVARGLLEDNLLYKQALRLSFPEVAARTNPATEAGLTD